MTDESGRKRKEKLIKGRKTGHEKRDKREEEIGEM